LSDTQNGEVEEAVRPHGFSKLGSTCAGVCEMPLLAHGCRHPGRPVGLLIGEHRPRVRALGRWSAWPSLTQSRHSSRRRVASTGATTLWLAWLFDHLVGERENVGRYFEAHRLRRLEIEDQIVPRGRL